MRKTIFIFGGLAAVLIILFQLNKLSLLGQQSNDDLFIIIAGIIFIVIGIVLSRLFRKDHEKPESPINEFNLKQTGLSSREYQIFKLVAEGQSNQEIADNLFISEHTVKSHISKILIKLDAKRRTHAIQIGRDLNII